jgi:hypothetical protein
MSNTDPTPKKTRGWTQVLAKDDQCKIADFSNDFVYYEVQDQNDLIM